LFAANAQTTGDAAIAARYSADANKLIDAALKDDAALKRLEYLCYRIGNRLSGSPALEQAVRWSVDEMTRAGLSNVRTIPVRVPHWIRGNESAEMLEPLRKPLFMLGLGNSVATPAGGITADVVTVSDFNELEALGRARVEGKIVLYDAPFTAYRETVLYRVTGASRAAHLGAVAALVRSVTPRSLRDPHTGSMGYAAADPKIPTAAVSVEDAMWIHRLTASGQRVRVHLEMQAHFEPDSDSADVMGEITGSTKPDEVVVIGGHLDSWDVGQGAHDDGGGIMAALGAVAMMKQLGLHPARTVRVVFWVNEENGARGGAAYQAWAGDQVAKHVAAIEMDGGAEKPVGFDLVTRAGLGRDADRMNSEATAIAALLKRIEAGSVTPGEGETDIAPLMNAGVPALGLRTVMTHYWDYHHTQADTFDKIVPEDFRRCVAAMAVMSYVMADWPQ
jgi:Iap family predicted aminopeptidase